MKAAKKTLVIGLIMTALLVLTNLPGSAKKPKKDAALARTRKQVKMLDDLYKTAVVLITEHYIEDDSSLPAGTAAKALFAAMKKNGWHEVRLLDVAGEPLEEENVAKDGFEKKAVAAMKAGKPYYDEVEQGKDGKRYLRAATIVPVVMKKCILCHPNYADAKKGAAIGTLSYKLLIE